jgi:hypothetical protein
VLDFKEETMNKKFIYYLSIVSITLTYVFLFHTPARAGILLTADYETGNFSQGPTAIKPHFCCSHSAQIVTSLVRAGKYAARFELRATDIMRPDQHYGRRSERIYKGDARIGKIGGPDEWYGFSIYLPSDYEIDDDPRRWMGLGTFEILAQWHSVPDKGEISPVPPLFLVTDNGKWKFITVHSSIPIMTSDVGKWVYLWEAPYQRGVWTDWVVHVKWSYKSDGFLEIWQNGKKIVDYKGPNCYNDRGNNYFQWGIYKAWWNQGPTHVTKRIVYNDELRIGDSNSSYAEVAPRVVPRVPDTTPPSPPTLILGTISQN